MGADMNQITCNQHSSIYVSFISVILMIGLLFLSGCSGGGSNADVTTVLQGRFIDSPVEGLDYETPTQSGRTNQDGFFNYLEGEEVTFLIGDVYIGTSPGKHIVTPLDLVPGSVDEFDPTVTNICRLLQSLDVDGNEENGITLTDAIRAQVNGTYINFDTTTEGFTTSEVEDMFAVLNETGAFIGNEPRGMKAPLQAQLRCGHFVGMEDGDIDACPNDADNDADGDGVCSDVDQCPGFNDNADSDGDGIADGCDTCLNDAAKTDPGICGCGVADTDSDGDGTADCNDSCPADAGKIETGICGCSVGDTDSDGDGTADCNDSCPADAGKIESGICGCGVADTDSDGDGTADCNDSCPADAGKIESGICGCGVADTDSDGDGTADCNDQCPSDAGKTAPGICGCGVADTDSDSDGTADCNDQCPSGAGKIETGICGCGVADTDSDGDGIADCNDACPEGAVYDADNDGVCDEADQCAGFDDNADADGDGLADGCDACPNDAPNDPDNDGICSVSPLCLVYDDGTNDDEDWNNGCDTNPYDYDGDGFCVGADNCTQDYNPDQADSDGDGIGDVCDICPYDKDNDADHDGFCGNIDPDPGFIGDTTAPQLDWLYGTCVTNGVKPAFGAAGEDFEFAIIYTDPSGCPSEGVFQVWIDLDGDGYSDTEQFDLEEYDPDDDNCTDGKVYTYASPIFDAGTYNYRFYANNGSVDGVGEAATTGRVEVVDAVAVYDGESIQDEIKLHVSDVTILVYEGIYPENIRLTTGNGNNSNVTIQSVCGPENTFIQGTFTDDPRTGTIGVQGVINPVIDGFTISGGYSGIVLNGGLTVKNCIIEKNLRGIYTITTHSRLTVEDTIIRDNGQTGDNIFGGSGVGIFFNSGGPHLISRSVITNNKATEGNGAGIYLQNSTCGLTIDNTVISNNTAPGTGFGRGMGGGVFCTRSYNGDPEPAVSINKSTINSNTSGASGGGLYLKDGCQITITNSKIVDNTTGSYGGGLFLGNYNNLPINLNIINSTVSNNKQSNTVGGAGGIFNRLSNVSIHNSIFWGNEAAGDLGDHGAYAWLGLGNSFVFIYSDVVNNQDNFSTKNTSVGNFEFYSTIDADPLFVDSDNEDYHLTSDSPAIDQGTSVDAPADDIDGDDRPEGSGYDMGADEYVPVQ